ncbi:hypothetical protein JVT61DRAFT_4369 [Boletus reticuloceps]|uniref:Uncharacterized protein n=1 Tax=Boletus reticuloceps TaxID=495285 RepID=A0A8I2YM37_9AGAM|nr:hypothetical protein JVT61DRAFT_4369 [Boletus reticuloceps]
MRAELANVRARSPLGPLSHHAYSAILRARTHYHIIRRHSRHPEVHAHYLETLLATLDPRLLNFAACDLSFLLRNHHVCHPRLQRLLYRLVIQHGGDLSTRSQEAILAALWIRACQRAGGTSNLVPEDGLSHITCHDCILDATAIARSLSTTLFGFAGRPPNHKSVTSLGYLFSVFSPAYSLPLRWNSLVLFSIFNASDILHFNGTHWTSDHTIPQVTSCWKVIFGLATVEKIVSEEPSLELATQSTPTDGVLETTRTLYQLWLPIIKPRLVSRDLACAITTSLLRIACILADVTLFYDCQDLYRTENSLEGPPTSAQKHLTAQYIAAAMCLQGPRPNAVLTTLEGFSLDSEQQHQVLASAVEALAPTDASLAYTIYSVAQGMGTELDPGATYALPCPLLGVGHSAKPSSFSTTVDFLWKNGQLSFPLSRVVSGRTHEFVTLGVSLLLSATNLQLCTIRTFHLNTFEGILNSSLLF